MPKPLAKEEKLRLNTTLEVRRQQLAAPKKAPTTGGKKVAAAPAKPAAKPTSASNKSSSQDVKVASENFDYRKAPKKNSREETLATRKQIRQFKQKWKQSGIDVVVDKEQKVLNDTLEAGFDNVNGKIYIKKDPSLINLYHEGYYAGQWLELGRDAYNKQSRLEKEEYVYKQVMKNRHLFDEASIEHSFEYINRLRRNSK
ncbi:zincin-like metallopeptidase toxin domain-containing protein [Lysinibacillus sp. NPDC093190]|uniref:zincin-like metallopeptidase toxin domain-containing protein n=1 Tax=Lysinibacillus sp. NPDC093190 TaxID=3390575 RepID=UPI003D026112